jgi:hypothetical protein
VEVGADRGHCLAGFHGGVTRTVQAGKELPAQRRVQGSHPVRFEQFEPTRRGVVPRDGLFRDLDLARGAQQRQGARRTKADPGDAGADLLPQFAGPKGHAEFVPGPAGHPHQSEVADGRPAGLDFAFELGDVVAPLDRLECVGGPEDPAADDRHTHGQ